MSHSPRERKWVQIEHPESRNDSPVTGYGLGFYIRGTGSAIEQRVHVVTTVSATLGPGGIASACPSSSAGTDMAQAVIVLYGRPGAEQIAPLVEYAW